MISLLIKARFLLVLWIISEIRKHEDSARKEFHETLLAYEYQQYQDIEDTQKIISRMLDRFHTFE